MADAPRSAGGALPEPGDIALVERLDELIAESREQAARLRTTLLAAVADLDR